MWSELVKNIPDVAQGARRGEKKLFHSSSSNKPSFSASSQRPVWLSHEVRQDDDLKSEGT